MKEEKIQSISKIKMLCKQCNTEVFADIGKSIEACPVCSKSINDTTVFKKLDEVIKELKNFNSFEFSLVCDKEQ